MRQEARMISLLRADVYAQLISAPKVADFLRDYLAGQIQELAIKTGFVHSSGMAQPGPDLERGTICAPHLPEGDVLALRFPIVSGDNNCLYKNVHCSELMGVKGAVWIHPEDAQKYHQCDFDGDQLVVSAVDENLREIAQETLRAREPDRYSSVIKRPKIPYTQCRDEKGERKYKILPEIALASAQNSIGLVATLIGRVQSSVPNQDEESSSLQLRRFHRDKRKLSS